MPDLEDQLRTYYEATTEPVDVDSVAVDPGTVIVGPFPEAAQRRSAMTAPTKLRETQPWWRNAWAAAAAFVVVAGIGVGVVVATDDGGGNADAVADEAPEEATLTFDGRSCRYEGPAAFETPARPSFRLVNDSDAVTGLSLWLVPNGTTESDIATGAFLEQPTPEGFLLLGDGVFAEPGEDVTLSTSLVIGQMSLNCFVTEASPSTPAGDWPVFITASPGG